MLKSGTGISSDIRIYPRSGHGDIAVAIGGHPINRAGYARVKSTIGKLIIKIKQTGVGSWLIPEGVSPRAVRVKERISFGVDLCTGVDADAIAPYGRVKVVEHVHLTVPNHRVTLGGSLEPVLIDGDPKPANVLSKAVVVSDQEIQIVVPEDVVGDGDKAGAELYSDQAVVTAAALRSIGRVPRVIGELAVVNPNE